MRVYRRKKKENGFDRSSGRESMPDIVYQMGAEAAARYALQNQRMGSPLLSGAVYTMPSRYPAVPVPAEAGEYEEEDYLDEEPVRASSPVNLIRSALGLNRSRSRQRGPIGVRDRFNRAGSPEHFAPSVRGSPIHFQARASSPFLLPQVDPIASPIPFMTPTEPSALRASPQYATPVRSTPADFARRVQRAQLSQQLQRIEQEQRLQASLINSNQVAYGSPFVSMPQSYYPMANMNLSMPSWPMMQGTPAPVYSYY